ncbi:MAG: hypothetical protein ACR2NV_09670 [Thermoleophilaceae bacterium]
MTIWWIGNAVVLLVVVPVVVFLLVRVLLTALAVRRGLNTLAEHGTPLVEQLEGLRDLERTRELVGELRSGLVRHTEVLEDAAPRGTWSP